MADIDMSDISEASSWADARADTPTLGENHSDSEDTLSNLSLEEILDIPPDPLEENHENVEKNGAENGHIPSRNEAPPVAAPRKFRNQVRNPPEEIPAIEELPLDDPVLGDIAAGALSASSSASFASATANGSVKVCITDADLDDMADSITLDLPPGAQYMPTSVDFPRSPSQLKSEKPWFMPKEEDQPGAISEDESSVSSFRAHLDLNLQNGDVRLTKKEFTSTPNSSKRQIRPNFLIPQINLENSENLQSEEEDESLSIIVDEDQQNREHLSIQSSNQSSNHDPSSLPPDCLDDYIEDFILPLSHESVMSRQHSFRRKVQKTLETVAAERASQELDRFDTMLSTYDEEDEHNLSRSLTPDLQNNPNYIPTNPPVAKTRQSKQSVVSNGHNDHSSDYSLQIKPNFDLDSHMEPQSLLDIDAIVNENAPNLMGFHKNNRKGSDGSSILPLGNYGSNGDLESMSNYFLPQQTLDKLYAVYESSNFNNIYCLSGEIKNILSAKEMEEIVANKDHLEKFIDPNVMAALHWSLNEASLPTYQPSIISPISLAPTMESNSKSPNDLDLNKMNLIDGEGSNNGLKSKSSSISNGFHSDASSSCEDDNQSTTSSSGVPTCANNNNNNLSNKKTVPVKDKDEYEDKDKDFGVADVSNSDSPSPTGFQRGGAMTNSMLRKIALSKGMRSPTPRNNLDTDEDNSSSRNLSKRTSEESLDDLGVGDEDWEDEEGAEQKSGGGVCLVRRDSKRFSFKGKDGSVIDRVVEGLFVESKHPNPKGTLRRIRAPLNLTETQYDDHGDEVDLDSLSPQETSLVDGDETELFNRDAPKTQKIQRKKISVDENILSIMSTDLDDASQATDMTQSDVFHSIINTLTDEDATMRTENDGDSDEITLDIDTPDDMEDSIMGQLESIVTSPMDRIPPLPAQEQVIDESMRWKSYRVGPADVQIDLQAIHPYRKCLSHGGYFDAEKTVAIILFSGCHLPDRSRKEYTYLMDHLFLYVLSSLEELIEDDYMLVYLHGATPKSCMPSYGWLKKCYQLINHRLRKNLKGLYLVHPTFWLRTVVALTRPFVSTKFSRKIRFMNTLSDLCLELPTEHLVIPDTVLQYDFDLKVDDLKRRKLMS